MKAGTLRRIGLCVAAMLMGPAWGQQPPAGEFDTAGLSQPQYKVRMDHNVKIRTRDGVDLSTDFYFPDAPGRFPTVLMRTPYNNNGPDASQSGKWYAERGYVYATQDVRGKYDSDGKFVLYANEANDGLDTMDWIAAQPWSNGRIGTLGGSYVGYTQIAPAIHRPNNLVAIAASVTTGNIFNDWTYMDGTLLLSFGIGWADSDMNGHGMQYSPAYDWASIYRHLPLMTMDQAAGQSNPGFRELLKHPRGNDPFWNGISIQKEMSNIPVPFLTVSGWYDIFLRGALQDQISISQHGVSELARRNKHIIIGPWTHMTGMRNANPDMPSTGPDRSVDFGPAAEVDLRDVYLRWQDRWLKGIQNGIDREPPYRIFVMGENAWRYENEWPLARTKYTKYYLHSGGKANSVSGDGVLSTAGPSGAAEDRFTYDPQDPVPTLGGNLLDCLRCNTVKWGPVNQARAEARNDVLVFSTPVLTEALEVTGPLKVKLFASSSARDTDWTAKLVDVEPDGYARNVQSGVIRARYRGGPEAPVSLLTPGKVYEYDIDLWATSNVFLPGHRIRVEISSSNFPWLDRNLNTGEDPITGVRMEKARQTVYHSRKYGSYILLPIIPRAKRT